MPRLFFDMTFTRTQSVNVGITRTVNRLLAEFEMLTPAQGMVCVPVVFHTSGFRAFSAGDAAEAESSNASARPSIKDRVREWITTGPVRQLVSRCPLPLRQLAWSAFSWYEFNRLSGHLPPVEIAPGDVLFLCDASWSYRVWTATRLARQRGAKVVTVVYDLIPLRQPQYCTPLTAIALRKWLARQMRCSDAVLCISRTVEDDLRQYARENGIGIPPTASFRLGCDPVVTGSNTVRAHIRDFMTGGPCFTAIGSFEPRKNYELLLVTFERLWARGIDAHLLIMGRPTLECEALLEKIEKRRGEQSRLLAVFDASDDEVAFAYANSRALLFPSLAEGFGLPLVEARTRGCLVIASDLAVFAELADEGVSMFAGNSTGALEEQLISHLPVDRRTDVRPMVPFTWADSARACLELIGKFKLTA
jgi:glycosyltransferase involved in cell wall biosynthesis